MLNSFSPNLFLKHISIAWSDKGTSLVSPFLVSFNMAIFIVSCMNLIIHTPELSNISWSPWLVSPRTHLNHHQGKNIKGTYSAPTLNLEYLYTFFKNITDFN